MQLQVVDFFGRGLGLGRPDYIPFAESDYIFASICEEMGILMGMGVVMLFLILTYRGLKTSMAQHNKFYKYVAFCLSLIFAFQSLIMFGGILKLIPLTGITIPFCQLWRFFNSFKFYCFGNFTVCL